MTESANSVLDKIVRRGKSVRGPAFTIYYGLVRAKLNPRIVVSARVDKRAVVRNRLRRQIRDILKFKDFSKYGLVVIVKKEVLKFDFSTLKQNLQSALNKI